MESIIDLTDDDTVIYNLTNENEVASDEPREATLPPAVHPEPPANSQGSSCSILSDSFETTLVESSVKIEEPTQDVSKLDTMKNITEEVTTKSNAAIKSPSMESAAKESLEPLLSNHMPSLKNLTDNLPKKYLDALNNAIPPILNTLPDTTIFENPDIYNSLIQTLSPETRTIVNNICKNRNEIVNSLKSLQPQKDVPKDIQISLAPGIDIVIDTSKIHVATDEQITSKDAANTESNIDQSEHKVNISETIKLLLSRCNTDITTLPTKEMPRDEIDPKNVTKPNISLEMKQVDDPFPQLNTEISIIKPILTPNRKFDSKIDPNESSDSTIKSRLSIELAKVGSQNKSKTKVVVKQSTDAKARETPKKFPRSETFQSSYLTDDNIYRDPQPGCSSHTTDLIITAISPDEKDESAKQNLTQNIQNPCKNNTKTTKKSSSKKPKLSKSNLKNGNHVSLPFEKKTVNNKPIKNKTEQTSSYDDQSCDSNRKRSRNLAEIQYCNIPIFQNTISESNNRSNTNAKYVTTEINAQPNKQFSESAVNAITIDPDNTSKKSQPNKNNINEKSVAKDTGHIYNFIPLPVQVQITNESNNNVKSMEKTGKRTSKPEQSLNNKGKVCKDNVKKYTHSFVQPREVPKSSMPLQALPFHNPLNDAHIPLLSMPDLMTSPVAPNHQTTRSHYNPRTNNILNDWSMLENYSRLLTQQCEYNGIAMTGLLQSNSSELANAYRNFMPYIGIPSRRGKTRVKQNLGRRQSSNAMLNTSQNPITNPYLYNPGPSNTGKK